MTCHDNVKAKNYHGRRNCVYCIDMAKRGGARRLHQAFIIFYYILYFYFILLLYIFKFLRKCASPGMPGLSGRMYRKLK